MNIEHVGVNYPDPVAAAEWYVKHLGMKIARQSGAPNHARFLADARSQVMVELYCNAKAPVPDYRAINPLVLHLAFFVDDVPGVRQKLLQAGATAEGEAFVSDSGDHLAMLRDPWGFPVQLVKRAKPMIPA
jgi:catechol 2,3-dioxygenase-like lactoylglutathione lyase family enzyme